MVRPDASDPFALLQAFFQGQKPHEVLAFRSRSSCAPVAVQILRVPRRRGARGGRLWVGFREIPGLIFWEVVQFDQKCILGMDVDGCHIFQSTMNQCTL